MKNKKEFIDNWHYCQECNCSHGKCRLCGQVVYLDSIAKKEESSAVIGVKEHLKFTHGIKITK